MQAKIDIHCDGGPNATIKLNGMDISQQVSRIEYVHKGGLLPEIKLAFPAAELSIDSLCNVEFPDAIFATLSKKQREELLADNPSLAEDLMYFDSKR